MNKVITNKVRFSYVHVFEPIELGGEPKYSLVVLVSKSDTDSYNRILAEINKTAQEAINEMFGGVMPANLAMPIYDGDGLKPSGELYGQECKGCWVINAKSSNAPEVVDGNCNPIISKNELYSGCYGRVSLNFYAYNKNGNKGIGCGLGNVQKLEDGQPLDGRTTAAEDFGMPIQPVSVSPQYQAPGQPQPVAPTYIGQVDPITGQPIPQTMQAPIRKYIWGERLVRELSIDIESYSSVDIR